MAPPPPKLGQRDLFNDSFFSFLKRKDKSHPQPAPLPAAQQSSATQESPHSPISNAHPNPKTDESLGQKKALLQDGHRVLDSTKDLLERNQRFFRKETLKRLRKQAAKLTKGAPAKNKLPKKSLGEVSNFQESAKVLYQEVDNIIREMDHNQGEYPGLVLAQQAQGNRSGSESPPPLPRKPPSPKVTFPAELKADPHGILARQQSVRHGYDLKDAPVTMPREDVMKHRYRDKEPEVRRGVSQRADDKYDRKDDDRYKDRDDRYRSRHASERHRDDYHRDRERNRDRERAYRQDYYSSRSRRYEDRERDRYRDREYRDHRPRDDRERDPERHRDRRERDRDREGDREREKDRDRDRRRDRGKESAKEEESTSADQTPQRVVHPDIPLSATPSGSNHGVPINPTIVPYPVEDGRRRDRDKEREHRDREREPRDRDRVRKERDRDRERDHRVDRDRDRDERDRYYSRRDEEYYRSKDRHKSSRRYEHDDEYRGSGRSRRNRERERDDNGEAHKAAEREMDREQERPRLGDSPPSPTDPSGSKFQEVFSPAERARGFLPSQSEAAG